MKRHGLLLFAILFALAWTSARATDDASGFQAAVSELRQIVERLESTAELPTTDDLARLQQAVDAVERQRDTKGGELSPKDLAAARELIRRAAGVTLAVKVEQVRPELETLESQGTEVTLEDLTHCHSDSANRQVKRLIQLVNHANNIVGRAIGCPVNKKCDSQEQVDYILTSLFIRDPNVS